MRFDAYSFSIRDIDLDVVAKDVCARIGAEAIRQERAGARQSCTYALMMRNTKIGYIGISLETMDRFVFGEVKGIYTPQFVAALRHYFPDHNCSRADVCEDYTGEGIYERFQAMGLAAILKRRGRRPSCSELADKLDSTLGRTQYFGKRGKDCRGFVRLYEKGKQMLQAGQDADPHWVRLEAEIHPDKAIHKRIAASLDPVGMLALAPIAHQIFTALANIDIEPFKPDYRENMHDRTLAYIARIGRDKLQQHIEAGCDLVALFEAIWQEQDAIKESIQERGMAKAA